MMLLMRKYYLEIISLLLVLIIHITNVLLALVVYLGMLVSVRRCHFLTMTKGINITIGKMMTRM